MFRLQLSTASGSAAALAMPATLVAAAAPAKATPVESSARRSSRPLSATCWISFLGLVRRDPAMRPSLLRVCFILSHRRGASFIPREYHAAWLTYQTLQ